MAIKVIERQEYYFQMECPRCHSILGFQKEDVIHDGLDCSVCGVTIYLPDPNKWPKMRGESNGVEVIERHEYHESKYLTRCCRCQSILRFKESDTTFDAHRENYSLRCPVCGYINAFELKSDWVIETEQLEEELDGNQSN